MSLSISSVSGKESFAAGFGIIPFCTVFVLGHFTKKPNIVSCELSLIFMKLTEFATFTIRKVF